MQYTDTAINCDYQWKQAGRNVLVCHSGNANDGYVINIHIDSCFEHDLRDDVPEADYAKWQALWDNEGDLDENEEFVSWVNRLVDARLPAHEQWEATQNNVCQKNLIWNLWAHQYFESLCLADQAAFNETGDHYAEELSNLTLRIVPIITTCELHEAEGAFFERHPNTHEAITDWMKNVNTLVYGTEPPQNIEHVA